MSLGACVCVLVVEVSLIVLLIVAQESTKNGRSAICDLQLQLSLQALEIAGFQQGLTTLDCCQNV